MGVFRMVKKIISLIIIGAALCSCSTAEPEPELITDIVFGTVTTAEGDGIDELGSYISYRDVPGIEPGDRVATALTRYQGSEPDDIISRADRIIAE